VQGYPYAAPAPPAPALTPSRDRIPLPIGGHVELLRLGEREPFATATVGGVDGQLVVLEGGRLSGLADRVTLRWWDDDEAWEASASVESTNPSGARLEVLSDWRVAVLRRAARVEIERSPVDLVTLGGDGREVRRLRVTCLDLSTTGCRVAGTGEPPSDGDILQVTASGSELAVCVDARIVHVVSKAFGGWQAGVEFLPHTAADRSALVAWRDSARHAAG
jgi:PilZ domain